MKALPIPTALVIALFVAGCSSSEQVSVGSEQRGSADQATGSALDASTGSASNVDFSAYKTYGWASQVNDTVNATFFANDASYKRTIRDAVQQQMVTRGYTYQPTTPDLIVNFRVFEQPTEIRDNSGYGDNYWTANEYRPDDAPRNIKLDKGSIFVQLVDSKKSEVVWQGYASGLGSGEAMEKDKAKVAAAVAKVFVAYTHRGDNQ
ncbi:DUF4136 domain-containing protein [Hymenobacter cavernae]|uniref:Lipoprotein n=1 Tax=Hymenobacter cavernae TaxID=2044852 RepID=A0ABQ1ULZ9_9BACT|nr:DUF4136 domain-containing protein [Hymenobacter cavernae]GGF21992.1 lipoprotein [Hymenobacter cavernae]